MPNVSVQNRTNEIPRPLRQASKDIGSFVQVQLEFLQGLIDQQEELYGDSAADLAALKNSYASIEQGIVSNAQQYGKILAQGAMATDADKAAIGAAGDAAVKALQADIDQFVQEGVRTAVEAVAPARGLRGSDTPMLQYLARETLEPANRAFAAGAANIRAGQAQNMLTYPLARNQADLQAAQFQQNALQNRLAINNSMASLFGQGQNQGLNLGSLVGAQTVGQVAPLFSAYTPLLSQFQDMDTGGDSFLGRVAMGYIHPMGAGGLMQGAGSLAPYFGSGGGAATAGSAGAAGSGASAAGAAAIGSSREWKFDAGEPEDVLPAIAGMPIRRWRYRDDPKQTPHIGPYAEDWRARLSMGDGKVISIIDAVGVLLKGIQELSAKLEKLEAQ